MDSERLNPLKFSRIKVFHRDEENAIPKQAELQVPDN